MFALLRKNVFLLTITVGQRSSVQFFQSLLFKNDRILRNDCSFSSLNSFKRLRRLNFLNKSLIF